MKLFSLRFRFPPDQIRHREVITNVLPKAPELRLTEIRLAVKGVPVFFPESCTNDARILHHIPRNERMLDPMNGAPPLGIAAGNSVTLRDLRNGCDARFQPFLA